MLWKDFREEGDCENCPLLKSELCTGGFQCYGGEPIEPPCCGFDDDTDLDEWVADQYERLQAYEEYEEKKLKETKERKERAKKAANTRREIRWYCASEILELKRIEKTLKARKAAEGFALSLAEALNLTNAMFQYRERATANPQISEEIKRLEAQLVIAKQKYEKKRKEFYLEREKKRKREARSKTDG